MLRHGSITDDGKIVIPIEIRHGKWKETEIRGGGGSKFRSSKVELADHFPIEPGFSVTLHKAQVSDQHLYEVTSGLTTSLTENILTILYIKISGEQGRTIRKVILAISEHPNNFIRMKWEGLYVALSRVKFSDDIRLLLRLGDRSTMTYISKLKKNAHIKSFFKGYTSLPGTNKEDDTAQPQMMIWDRDLSCKDAGYK